MATFCVLTFGCQMNVRDSQWLVAALEARGLSKAELALADAVIINTCSVREKPEQKVLHTLGRIRQISRKKPLVAVCGCVAQQLGEKLFAVSKETRLVAGADGMAAMPDAIARLLENQDEKLAFLDFDADFPEREIVEEENESGSAFVNIMQGCDNFCSYCIVPFTRGRQKSRQKSAVLEECRRALAKGAREITLLGQNVNAWGTQQWDGGKAFAGLLREVAQLAGLQRLRFVTPHPADLGPEVVACFAELPVLCPRLHLPLQAGSDKILKAMRRRHSRLEYLELVAALKLARPDLALSTDLIVGFPGETEDDFAATLAMLEQCGFMSSYSFCYSDRPGTRASLMPDKIDQQTKLDRLKRLQERQEALTVGWLGQRLGQHAEIMLEQPSPRGGADSWQGRDIYGVCVNAAVPAGRIGEIAAVEITGIKKHSLVGKLINY